MSAVAALVPLMVLSESGFLTRNAVHFNGFEWMDGRLRNPKVTSHQTDTVNSVYPALCAIAVVILGSLGEVGACSLSFRRVPYTEYVRRLSSVFIYTSMDHYQTVIPNIIHQIGQGLPSCLIGLVFPCSLGMQP